jgi:hypothetical protein
MATTPTLTAPLAAYFAPHSAASWLSEKTTKKEIGMNMQITKDELFKLTARKLWHGEYIATDNFKSIEKHASVCFEDGALVAVTGRADDRESQLYAAMFADAPAMLLEIAKLRNAVEAALTWLDKFGEHAPIEFGGEQELHDVLQDAIAAQHSVHPTAVGGSDEDENSNNGGG